MSNDLPNESWPYGISLAGSGGTENQVSDNHFEPGIYLFSYRLGVNVQDFKNTRFCTNSSINTGSFFSFAGQNDGTDFTNNIAHGVQLIRLSGESWIEEQDQKGNQWTLEYNQFVFPFWADPQVECTDPNYAALSRFRVHTLQSTTTNGLGFNPYHPKDIVPDDDDEWWSQQNGSPESCDIYLTGTGNGNTELKRRVANGSLASLLSNPSMMWQAERALYFALKRNLALESEYSAYTTFLTAKTGSNIDKFYQVASALDAARNGSATLVADAESNRIAIDNLLTQIEAADQAWQNAATPAEEESAKNAKKQKLGELMGLLQNAANLQVTYKQNLQTALASVQQINNSIMATADWETYEKTTNSIFLGYLQNEEITEGQKEDLEAIAKACPKYGGMAVYKARGILPECAQIFDWDNYEGCYPAPEPLTLVEPRSNDYTALQDAVSVQVVPNPATEISTVIVPNGRQGSIRIFSAFGNLVSEQRITSPTTTFSVTSFPTGIYYLEVLFTDGQRECLKLVISR